MTDWKELLMDACERVQAVVEGSNSPRARGRVVGTGAAGDETLVADREAEKEILDSLSSVAPLRVISEEIGTVGDRSARYTAIVDPLDGSSNFGRGLPFYCTSIGIAEGTGIRDMKRAIVRNLVNGDVYYAERGVGATKNGKKIRTSYVSELSESVVGVDLSRASMSTTVRLAPLVSSVRRQVHFGANALELCLLAEGKFEAFVDLRGKMRITDFAGAFLIASEAGAIFSAPDGKALEPALGLEERFGFLASANRSIHRRILDRLRPGRT